MDEHTLQSFLHMRNEVQVELGLQKCAVGQLLDSFRAHYEFTARQNWFVLVHFQQFAGEDSSPLRVVGESIVCMFEVKGQRVRVPLYG